MNYTSEQIVKAMIKASQRSNHPLEVVRLDDSWCIRMINDKSVTLTAGKRGDPDESQFKRILLGLRKMAQAWDFNTTFECPDPRNESQMMLLLTIQGYL